MIVIILSVALVVAVPLAFAHGHAQGIRWAEADLLALLRAKAQRKVVDGGDA